MASKLLLAVFLLVGSSQVLAQDVGFDYLNLVRTWSPEECDEKACSTPPPALFTIHGLWPQYEPSGYPSSCSSNRFSTSQLSPTLLKQMECEWPSYRGSSASFWSYEWDKHGTCAEPLFGGQEEYFSSAIELHNKYEPNVALQNAGIDPADAGSYSLSELDAAFQKAWGVKTVFSCNSADFYEVWMCFTNDLQPRDCPSSLRGRPCSGSASFVAGNGIPASCSTYYSNDGSSPSSTPSTGGGSGNSNSLIGDLLNAGIDYLTNGSASAGTSLWTVVFMAIVGAVMAL